MSKPRDAEGHHLIGGVLCLDFANTLYGHDAPIHEYLLEYRDLVLWSRHVDVLSKSEAGHLLQKWEQEPAESESVLTSAIQRRETIYRIFSSLAHGRSPTENDIGQLHQAWLNNLQHTQLVRDESGFILGWEEGHSLDQMLWPITRSAVDLLTSADLKRVKQCGGCDWLFMDRSRNQKRRWCSMNACGNRAKMARRYRRMKRQAVPHS
jgi:predicted RNA-binding Zn ribbon-like protein